MVLETSKGCNVFGLSSSHGVCERLRGEGTQYEGLVISTDQFESISFSDFKVLEHTRWKAWGKKNHWGKNEI